MVMADRLAADSYYTEAALRLGRATEATLYAVARELGMPLTNQTIKSLSKFKDMIDERIVRILKKGDFTEVKGLAQVVENLAETIAELASNTQLLAGEDDHGNTRPTEQILRALISLVDDSQTKRQLGMSAELLRSVQDNRNRSAHASTDGSRREFTEDEYLDYSKTVESFLILIFNLVVAQRAKLTFMSKTEMAQVSSR